MRWRTETLKAVPVLVCLALAVAPAGEARVTALLPYRDPALTAQARAADLLSRMTLAEKIGQMTQAERGAVRDPADIGRYALGSLLSGGGSAPPDNTPAGWADMTDGFQKAALGTRLGIPLLYGTDAVHGNNNLLGAVLFPHNIGLGAARDPALTARIARATAEEVAATGANWTFSPCLCVARDVRWGRTYESFGERPDLVSQMSSAVAGYQGTPGEPGSILATAKHFLGDGGTTFASSSTDGYLLDQGDTRLTETQLRALHLPPFRAAVRAGVGSVMVSFSSWNGVKMHAQARLISEVLKGELGFQGFVVSDWAGVDQISPDYSVAVRTAINAGVDMVMVPNDYPRFVRALTGEVKAGRVPVARIDDAVTRILTQKFRFGLFEHPLTDRSFASGVGSAAHRDLARQAVRESLVLLKNDHLLPISSSVKRLLVTGSSADDLGRQLGGWSVTWQGKGGRTTTGTTILAGLRAQAGSGVKIDHLENVSAAQAARYDLGVVVVGEAPYAEGKGDVRDLSLNAADRRATETVCGAVNCLVIVVSGRPLLLTDQLPRIGALVAAWLPGTEGAGVADMLFGPASFTGRLPVTWPRTNGQLPVGRPQDAGPPLFPYGFGLSH
ncbi:glycoside hydrolase family 3 protein [Deinococcus altitudinis]|uniref:glycoside hydrolase family 3 protein n=1 Tax=Deinococcus altitudinis TaxID=468914 RepID=UPI0038929065